MTPVQALPWLLVGTPFASGVLLLAVAERRLGAWINVAASGATLTLALLLTGAMLPDGPASGPRAGPAADSLLRGDALAAWAALLTGIVGLTAAWHGRACITADVLVRRFVPARARLFHSGFQILQGSVLLALVANRPGLAWLAVLGAALVLAFMHAVTAVPQPSLPGARPAAAAARHALLAAAGLAPALLGTTVLALAAGTTGEAGGWGSLSSVGRGTLPQLGFALLLAGYGLLAGLAPLAPLRWDAKLDGAAGMPAILATGLSNAALVLLLRAKTALGAAPGWDADTGDPLAGAGLMALLGLLSLLLGAAGLWHRPGHAQAGRWLAAAGAVQAGTVALAFALGGAATQAGLLYMAAATLARTGAAMALGRAAQRRGSAELRALGALHDVGRGTGVLVLLCLAALAGLPPAGVSSGQVLLGMEASRHSPVIAVALAGAYLVAGWSLVACGARFLLGVTTDRAEEGSTGASPGRHQPGARPSGPAPGRWDLVPVWAHLLLLLLLGLLPAPVAALVAQAAAGVR